MIARLGCRLPIIQAPMLGASTIPLAAAVASAGGLGNLPLAGTPPEEVAVQVDALRNSCNGAPHGVNFFVLPDPPRPGTPEALKYEDQSAAFTETFRRDLGLATRAPSPVAYGHSFQRQVESLLAHSTLPPVVSFTFGCPDEAIFTALKARGVFTLATATTAAEARALVDAGAQGVVAQGAEAGGHRGSFLAGFEESMVGTVALVPAVVDACGPHVLVVAAGGIADGRGVAAALALGARAVQVGTAFLAARESGAPRLQQEAVARASAEDGHTRVVVTRAFSGRPARGFAGPLTDAERSASPPPCLPPYPVHNQLTKDLRAEALRAGRPELTAMWCGQAVGLARGGESAAAIIARLVQEAQACARCSDDSLQSLSVPLE